MEDTAARNLGLVPAEGNYASLNASTKSNIRDLGLTPFPGSQASPSPHVLQPVSGLTGDKSIERSDYEINRVSRSARQQDREGPAENVAAGEPLFTSGEEISEDKANSVSEPAFSFSRTTTPVSSSTSLRPSFRSIESVKETELVKTKKPSRKPLSKPTGPRSQTLKKDLILDRDWRRVTTGPRATVLLSLANLNRLSPYHPSQVPSPPLRYLPSSPVLHTIKTTAVMVAAASRAEALQVQLAQVTSERDFLSNIFSLRDHEYFQAMQDQNIELRNEIEFLKTQRAKMTEVYKSQRAKMTELFQSQIQYHETQVDHWRNAYGSVLFRLREGDFASYHTNDAVTTVNESVFHNEGSTIVLDPPHQSQLHNNGGAKNVPDVADLSTAGGRSSKSTSPDSVPQSLPSTAVQTPANQSEPQILGHVSNICRRSPDNHGCTPSSPQIFRESNSSPMPLATTPQPSNGTPQPASHSSPIPLSVNASPIDQPCDQNLPPAWRYVNPAFSQPAASSSTNRTTKGGLAIGSLKVDSNGSLQRKGDRVPLPAHFQKMPAKTGGKVNKITKKTQQKPLPAPVPVIPQPVDQSAIEARAAMKRKDLSWMKEMQPEAKRQRLDNVATMELLCGKQVIPKPGPPTMAQAMRGLQANIPPVQISSSPSSTPMSRSTSAPSSIYNNTKDFQKWKGDLRTASMDEMMAAGVTPEMASQLHERSIAQFNAQRETAKNNGVRSNHASRGGSAKTRSASVPFNSGRTNIQFVDPSLIQSTGVQPQGAGQHDEENIGKRSDESVFDGDRGHDDMRISSSSTPATTSTSLTAGSTSMHSKGSSQTQVSNSHSVASSGPAMLPAFLGQDYWEKVREARRQNAPQPTATRSPAPEQVAADVQPKGAADLTIEQISDGLDDLFDTTLDTVEHQDEAAMTCGTAAQEAASTCDGNGGNNVREPATMSDDLAKLFEDDDGDALDDLNMSNFDDWLSQNAGTFPEA